MRRGELGQPGERRTDRLLCVGEMADHLPVLRRSIALGDLGALQMDGELALGGLADGAHAFGEIVLAGEVILVDRLEQCVQLSEGHAGHVPVVVLRKHRGHDGLGQGLVEGCRDLDAGVGRQVGCGLCHVGSPSNGNELALNADSSGSGHRNV